VSILGLVLVKDPYYNEAGYDTRMGSEAAKGPASQYAEKAYMFCRGFVKHALANDISDVKDIISWLYVDTTDTAPRLLDTVIEELSRVVAQEGKVSVGGLDRVSKGALAILKRQYEDLVGLRGRLRANKEQGE